MGVVIRVNRVPFRMPRGRFAADFVEHCELSLDSCMELELELELELQWVAGLDNKHEASYARKCAPYFLLLEPISPDISTAFTR
jgi:hypothetical protein